MEEQNEEFYLNIQLSRLISSKKLRINKNGILKVMGICEEDFVTPEAQRNLIQAIQNNRQIKEVEFHTTSMPELQNNILDYFNDRDKVPVKETGNPALASEINFQEIFNDFDACEYFNSCFDDQTATDEAVFTKLKNYSSGFPQTYGFILTSSEEDNLTLWQRAIKNDYVKTLKFFLETLELITFVNLLDKNESQETVLDIAIQNHSLHCAIYLFSRYCKDQFIYYIEKSIKYDFPSLIKEGIKQEWITTEKINKEDLLGIAVENRALNAALFVMSSLYDKENLEENEIEGDILGELIHIINQTTYLEPKNQWKEVFHQVKAFVDKEIAAEYILEENKKQAHSGKTDLRDILGKKYPLTFPPPNLITEKIQAQVGNKEPPFKKQKRI